MVVSICHCCISLYHQSSIGYQRLQGSFVLLLHPAFSFLLKDCVEFLVGVSLVGLWKLFFGLVSMKIQFERFVVDSFFVFVFDPL